MTCVTDDSWIDDGLTKCEPQACANLSLGGSVGRNSTASGEISRTLTTVVVSVTIAEKKAPMVRMRRTRVCGTTALFPRFTILFSAPRSAVLPPSY